MVPVPIFPSRFFALAYCVIHSTVCDMVGSSDPFSKLELELRRGAIVLAALSQLTRARRGAITPSARPAWNFTPDFPDHGRR